jgi:hypothetical protein
MSEVERWVLAGLLGTVSAVSVAVGLAWLLRRHDFVILPSSKLANTRGGTAKLCKKYGSSSKGKILE